VKGIRAARRWVHKLVGDPDVVRASRLGLVIGLWIVMAAMAVRATVYYLVGGGLGLDAHTYWTAGHLTNPYQAGPGARDAYLYSPAFLQLIGPLTRLPWPVFEAVWLTIAVVAGLWLFERVPWRWRGPVMLMAVPQLCLSNVYAVLGVCIVVGLRSPAVWAFPLLTKVTGAAPGYAWFVGRGEWGKAARAAGFAVVVVGISYISNPGLWRDWITFLGVHQSQGHAVVARTVAAVLIGFVAGRYRIAWLLPLAVMVSITMAGGGLGLGGQMNSPFAMVAITVATYWRTRDNHTFSGQLSGTSAAETKSSVQA